MNVGLGLFFFLPFRFCFLSFSFYLIPPLFFSMLATYTRNSEGVLDWTGG